MIRRVALLAASCVTARAHTVPAAGALLLSGGPASVPRAKACTPYMRDGVVFVERGFLAPDDFETVAIECRSLRSKMKLEKNSIAIGRTGYCLTPRSSPNAWDVLTSDSVISRIGRLVGRDPGLPPLVADDYPPEVRTYRAGSGMEWHQDEQLYEEPQCEVVLCIENTSDSYTEWEGSGGAEDCHSFWTPPNSALLVRAGPTGARHRVRTLQRGERTIVKMVFSAPGSGRLPEFYAHLDSFPGLRRAPSTRRAEDSQRQKRRRRRR